MRSAPGGHLQYYNCPALGWMPFGLTLGIFLSTLDMVTVWNTNRLQKIDIEYSIFTHRYGVLEFLEGCMAEHLSASL